jgi:ADP-ribose pyrophosphatase YjhB (NUDIX family)
LSGGRVDRNETATAGFRREITEETGFDPTIVTPVQTFVWQNEAGNGHLAVYYYCRTSQRSVSLSSEHDAYRWNPVDEVRSQLSDPQETAVNEALSHHREVNAD